MRPLGGVVGGPQIGRQLVLLTVVHATRSEGLSGPDITAGSTLSTLAATEEGESGKDDVPETHNTDGSDESNDEALVLAVPANVEVTVRIAESAGGVSAGVSGGQGGVRRGVGRIGRGPRWGVRLKLPGGLIGTADSTAGGAFLKSEGDVIGDL